MPTATVATAVMPSNVIRGISGIVGVGDVDEPVVLNTAWYENMFP